MQALPLQTKQFTQRIEIPRYKYKPNVVYGNAKPPTYGLVEQEY